MIEGDDDGRWCAFGVWVEADGAFFDDMHPIGKKTTEEDRRVQRDSSIAWESSKKKKSRSRNG